MTHNAPIVLFVYNRPEHTKRTIESLQANAGVSSSSLFIFSDGPKSCENRERFHESSLKVEEVRKYIRSIRGFQNVEIMTGETNRGLAESVISGVTSVLQQYDRAIVLEDDLLLSPMFLTFMNEALYFYQDDASIFSIGGYTPPVQIPQIYPHDVYLCCRCSTWGWATWKDRWNKTDWEVKDYAQFRQNKNMQRRFSRGGQDLPVILDEHIQGKVSSWAIRWDYAHFKEQAFALKPIHSLVTSTGLDGSGVHCSTTNRYTSDISRFYNAAPKLVSQLTVDKTINERCAEFYDQQPRSFTGKTKQLFVKSVRKVFRILNVLLPK